MDRTDASEPAGVPGPDDRDERSTPELLASVYAHGQALVTKEIELAKLELQEALTDKAIGIGLALGAAVLGLFILGFVGVTAATLLALVLPEWAAWLIVTGAYTLLAVVLGLVAARLFQRPVMARTREAIEDTAAWARRETGRPDRTRDEGER